MKGGAFGDALGSVHGYLTACNPGARRAAGFAQTPAPLIVARFALPHGVSFAAWCSTFQGSCCALARIRGHRDVADAYVAGGFAGAVALGIEVARCDNPLSIPSWVVRGSLLPFVSVSALAAVGYDLFFGRAPNASGNATNDTSALSGAYPHEPNCISNVTSGAAQDGALGNAFGGKHLLSDARQRSLRRHKETFGLVISGAQMLCAHFAFWGAAFRGSYCILTRIRGHRNITDAGVAGGFASAVSIAASSAISEKQGSIARQYTRVHVPLSVLVGDVLGHFNSR